MAEKRRKGQKDREPKRSLYDQGSTEVPGGVPKEYREVLQEAKEQGWRFVERHGYPIAVPPDPTKDPVPIPKTPKKHARSFENWRSKMRRSGLRRKRK